MQPRCETIGKYILPVFRSLVAKELIKTYDLTQVETAKKLGTTQAAISQYINSKRARKSGKDLDRLLPNIQEMASETARRLANKELNWDEATGDFCKLCKSFCEKQVQILSDDNYAI
jgi:predicted transcriptional regulator